MSEEAPEWDERTFLSLAALIGIRTRVAHLATAIEQKGIQGWDRFGRFKTFNADSKGEDAATYRTVFDALAAQHEWEQNEDNIQAVEQSPAEMSYSGPFYFGWFDDEAPDFSATVAKAAGQPSEPPKQARPSVKGENYNLKLIGALVGFIAGEISANAHPDYDKADGMKGLGKLLANKYDTGSGEVYARRLSNGVQALKEETE